MSSNVLYEANPTVIADGAEKTPLGDNIGRQRVVVDVLPPAPPPGPPDPNSLVELSSGWVVDYSPPAVRVPGWLQYLSMRTKPASAPAKSYVLVFDATAAPNPGDLAVETFGTLVKDDFDWWEPTDGQFGWYLQNGLYVIPSATPVVYTPFGVGPGSNFAYTVKYVPV